MDPINKRRGDIRNPESWYKDLKHFTAFVRKKYPKAEVIWFGESMGAMITLNSFAFWQNKGEQLCNRMILSAPVINLKKHLKSWQVYALHIAAKVIPSFRISLDRLTGGEKHEITDGLFQTDDAAKNTYLIESFTLRFLYHFSKEVEKMHKSIRKVSIPLAIVHGGEDFLSSPPKIEEFFNSSISQNKQRFFYPEAYHLILYDALSEKIFTDLLNWLQLPK